MNHHPQPFSLPSQQQQQNPSGFPFPLDPATLAAFQPFMVQSEHRRRNATREVTAPLKHWLNQHRKNPYPTKAEKTFLALVTRMTMTQVSTWFANARRRLKKESGNMSWPQRSSSNDDLEEGDRDDDVDIDNEENNNHLEQNNISSLMMMTNGDIRRINKQQNLIGQQWPNIFNGQQHLIGNNEGIILNNNNELESESPSSSSQLLKEKEEEEDVIKEKKLNGTEKRSINRKRKIWSIAETLKKEEDLIKEDNNNNIIVNEEKEENVEYIKRPYINRNALSLSSFHDLTPKTTEKLNSPISSKNFDLKNSSIYPQNNNSTSLLSHNPLINGCSTTFRNIESILQQQNQQQQQLLMLGLHPQQLALGSGGLSLPQIHPGIPAADPHILALAFAHHQHQQLQNKIKDHQQQQQKQQQHSHQLTPFMLMAAQHLAATMVAGGGTTLPPNNNNKIMPSSNEKAEEPSFNNENNCITSSQQNQSTKSNNSSPINHSTISILNNNEQKKQKPSLLFDKKQQILTDPIQQNGIIKKEELKECDKLDRTKE